MSDVIRRRTAAVTSWTRRHRYRCGVSLGRWTRAWRYAAGRLSADEAQRLMLAREEIADHPDLPRLVADGCARVADKWESYNDELWEARRWAIGLAKR